VELYSASVHQVFTNEFLYALPTFEQMYMALAGVGLT